LEGLAELEGQGNERRDVGCMALTFAPCSNEVGDARVPAGVAGGLDLSVQRTRRASSCLGCRASAVNACVSVAWNALSLFGRGSRRYFGALLTDACSHFETVLRDSPVMRAISRSDSLSLTCSRRILPIMSMVITPRTPLLK